MPEADVIRLGPEGPYCQFWYFAQDAWWPRNIWHRFFCRLCRETTKEKNAFLDRFSNILEEVEMHPEHEKATALGVYHGDELVQVHCEQTSDEQCNVDDARKAGHAKPVTWGEVFGSVGDGLEGDPNCVRELLCEHCFGNIG